MIQFFRLEAVVEPWVDGLWKPLQKALSSSQSFLSPKMNSATRQENVEPQNGHVATKYSVNVEALIERLSGVAIANQNEKRNPLISSEKTPSYPEKVSTTSAPEPFLKIQFGTEVCISFV